MSVRRSLSLALLTLLAGCAGLPGDGPTAMDVSLHQTRQAGVPDAYVLVQLDATVLHKINAYSPYAFPAEFKSRLGGRRNPTLGVGDKLVVNIWEPSPDGVFATAEKKQAGLQAVVDELGQIYIPYAGRLRASGRKVEELRRAIEARLAGKAVDPQVQVLVEDNQANSVAIVGDVASPKQLPMPERGLRLMEAVALAGGAKAATYETVVKVARGRRSGTVRLDEVISNPANNIWLAPGDNVLALHKPRTYSAFGAVQNSGLIAFKSDSLSLTEALAQVGGLQDLRADAGGVFLLRFESRQLARSLIESGQGRGRLDGYAPGLTPVIYRLDFKNPQAFFIAEGVRMQDKDVLFVANHPTAEFAKFLGQIVSPLLRTAVVARTF